jgi:hypothetical protein
VDGRDSRVGCNVSEIAGGTPATTVKTAAMFNQQITY